MHFATRTNVASFLVVRKCWGLTDLLFRRRHFWRTEAWEIRKKPIILGILGRNFVKGVTLHLVTVGIKSMLSRQSRAERRRRERLRGVRGYSPPENFEIRNALRHHYLHFEVQILRNTAKFFFIEFDASL